jgi:hypothetical protein
MEPITSERQVVYILVETRKLLELLGLKDVYPQLMVFCDWVVHPTLDRKPARQIIKPFDISVVAARRRPITETELEANPNAMQEFLGDISGTFDMAGFVGFKEELERFYRSQQITCCLVRNQKEWLKFLGYYTSVIEDCPLKCKDNTMVHVRTLLVRKVAANSYFDESKVRLNLEWIWVRPDGRESVLLNSTLAYPPGPAEESS